MTMFNVASILTAVAEFPTAEAGVEHLFAEGKALIAKVEADKGDVGKAITDVIEALFNNKSAITAAVVANTPAAK